MGEGIGTREADSFTASAQRLSGAFALDGDEPPSRDVERVKSALLLILLARFGPLGAAELCDIADEAIARLLNESRRQGRALDNAAGWLRTTARNLAHDRFKGPQLETLDDHEAVEDEFATRLLERLTSDDQVKRGLRAAVKAGDDVAVRVVVDYLDLADEMSGSPSTRAVAERCGYSHTTVQEVLKRFRRYLK